MRCRRRSRLSKETNRSAIRDSCSRRVAALISEPHAGMSQGLYQKVLEITEHNSQRQHALMMALARGEMPYGQFVQEDTLIGIRTAAAIRPFTQEAGVIDQVAMATPAADQSAAALGAFVGNLLGTTLARPSISAAALAVLWFRCALRTSACRAPYRVRLRQDCSNSSRMFSVQPSGTC